MIDASAQEADCANLTIEKGFKSRTIRKSKAPIVFKVTEVVTARMIFTNSRYPNTLQAELTFEEDSGFLVDLGNILTLNFADGTHTDFIVGSRKAFTSVAFFTFLKPANPRAKKVMAYEDRLLYEKLIQIDITSFDYSMDNKKIKLTVSNLDSETIRKTVGCLIFTERNEEN